MNACHRRTLLQFFVPQAVGAGSASVAVAALATPTERPILTVRGRISVRNHGNAALFDRPMLERLGLASFTTPTPWYDHPVTFEGVPMSTLMLTVGAEGETVTALALNDYTTDIPISDFARFDVLLALKRDGVYMSVRDEGPLFIVYPYYRHQELQTRRYYSRSAWQVAELVVK
jgi:hypothetical protein